MNRFKTLPRVSRAQLGSPRQPRALRFLYTGRQRLFTVFTLHCLSLWLSSDERKSVIAMDFIYVALIVIFFAATAGLIRFCAALMDKGGRS